MVDGIDERSESMGGASKCVRGMHGRPGRKRWLLAYAARMMKRTSI
jgi:hypothetical protein